MIQKLNGPSVASAKPINPIMQRDSYNCPELRPYQGRPGAMDAFNLPSLINGRRVWRDGRVEEVEGGAA